jgi:hypothetical protein
MPQVYLPNDLYNEIIKKGLNVTEFVREAVKDKLEVVER